MYISIHLHFFQRIPTNIKSIHTHTHIYTRVYMYICPHFFTYWFKVYLQTSPSRNVASSVRLSPSFSYFCVSLAWPVGLFAPFGAAQFAMFVLVPFVLFFVMVSVFCEEFLTHEKEWPLHFFWSFHETITGGGTRSTSLCVCLPLPIYIYIYIYTYINA